LPVVFDFDNTIISGDIGEAVLAVLASKGRLRPKNICETLSPDLHPRGNCKMRPRDYANIMEYYEALLAPTIHGEADPTPLANGYVWAAQVLEKLSLAEVLEATLHAIRLGETIASGHREIIVGNLSYPAPRFREEMVELIALLLRLGYRPWVVSASNVWSVRWMVVHALNPLLAHQGAAEGLPPEQVIGLATLLSDRTGRLYKDSVLVREDPGYANLSSKWLKSLRVTRHVQFPAPVYSGKVACILDALGCNPYLSAGDSPSDHPMLAVSRNRLWIARADKPDAQRATQALMRHTGKTGWIVHPVAAPGNPG
jgi:phosphoserine phosphatase